MLKPLLLVIALGAGIGMLWPSGRAPAPVAAVAAMPGAAKETVLTRAPNGHFYADVEVNGGLVHVVVDTGATDVALTVEDARRIGIPFSESDFQPVGEGASGIIRGTMVTLDKVSLDGKEAKGVRAAILEGLPISLLGQTYLARLGSIEVRGDSMKLE